MDVPVAHFPLSATSRLGTSWYLLQKDWEKVGGNRNFIYIH